MTAVRRAADTLGPGTLRVFPVVTSPWQCGQVSTGWVTWPQRPGRIVNVIPW